MSFRAKTALTVALLTVAALGGAFTVVSLAFNGLQRRELDASLLDVAREEAREAPANGMAFDDRPGPAANDVGPLTKYGIIYDAAGRVLAATPPFDTKPLSLSSIGHPPGDAFDLRFGNQHLRGVVVDVPANPGVVLFLATSREDLDGDEAFLYRAMLTAFAATVAWVSAVAFFLGARLSRYHAAIATVARNVASGNLSARVRLHSDDREVAQLGRDLNDMVEQLADLLSSQERFIAHAAHEPRSPLTALYGELQQALRKQRDAESYRATIEAALTATRRLKQLSDDLLALARARGRDRSQVEPVLLERALAEALSFVESSADERRVTMLVEPVAASEVPDSGGDTARMLRNVLENAVRHSPPGGTVRLESNASNGAVRVVISDDGPGIEVGERQRVFEPFFRSRNAEQREGTGLGLSIAREIARAHGGDITLDDEGREHAGACFVISMRSA